MLHHPQRPYFFTYCIPKDITACVVLWIFIKYSYNQIFHHLLHCHAPDLWINEGEEEDWICRGNSNPSPWFMSCWQKASKIGLCFFFGTANHNTPEGKKRKKIQSTSCYYLRHTHILILAKESCDWKRIQEAVTCQRQNKLTARVLEDGRAKRVIAALQLIPTSEVSPDAGGHTFSHSTGTNLERGI